MASPTSPFLLSQHNKQYAIAMISGDKIACGVIKGF